MQQQAAHDDILQRLKDILRRDLKLGQAGEIPDDLPLIGGEMDLDSLDVLLMVASVEKEFGLKFPSQIVGESAFKNLETLAAYLREHAGMPAQPAVDPVSRLPHREPFLFVSRVTVLKPRELAEGIWQVSGKEPFFAGHFPGQPIVPGVLLGEALAQLSGLVGAGENGDAAGSGRLAHIELRLNQGVTPPAEIVLKSRLTRVMGALRQFTVTALLDTTVVAEGTVALHQAEAPGPKATT